MAELHRVEINEKAPNEIEPTEEKPQEQAQVETEELPQEQSDRPEWLPEKFKDPADMAKAYSELEKKLGQTFVHAIFCVKTQCRPGNAISVL